MGRKRRYSEEFMEQAVTLALKGERALTEIAESLGISVWTLRDWRKKHLERQSLDKRRRGKETRDEELERLRKENADLKMDNAILKKYAAMMSKDQ